MIVLLKRENKFSLLNKIILWKLNEIFIDSVGVVSKEKNIYSFQSGEATCLPRPITMEGWRVNRRSGDPPHIPWALYKCNPHLKFVAIHKTTRQSPISSDSPSSFCLPASRSPAQSWYVFRSNKYRPHSVIQFHVDWFRSTRAVLLVFLWDNFTCLA